MRELTRDERLLLLKFVCSFAWADLEVRPQERAFVARLMGRLELDAEDRKQVEAWLESPPPLDSLDPQRVPKEHRMSFIRSIESVIAVDGDIDPLEREQLVLLSQLLR